MFDQLHFMPVASHLGAQIYWTTKKPNRRMLIEQFQVQWLHIRTRSPRLGNPLGTKYMSSSIVLLPSNSTEHSNACALPNQEMSLWDRYKQESIKSGQEGNPSKKRNHGSAPDIPPSFGLQTPNSNAQNIHGVRLSAHPSGFRPDSIHDAHGVIIPPKETAGLFSKQHPKAS